MAETSTKRYVKLPYEIYFNEHTCLYHLIEHKGELKDTGAWSVDLLGRYEKFMDAKTVLEQLVEEALHCRIKVTFTEE